MFNRLIIGIGLSEKKKKRIYVNVIFYRETVPDNDISASYGKIIPCNAWITMMTNFVFTVIISVSYLVNNTTNSRVIVSTSSWEMYLSSDYRAKIHIFAKNFKFLRLFRIFQLWVMSSYFPKAYLKQVLY